MENVLSKLNVEQKARETKFYKASPRKVSITNLMLSFFSMALTGKNGYSKWAEHLAILIGDTVSKVAIWKRMNKEQVDCLHTILEEVFKNKVYQHYLSSKKILPCLAHLEKYIYKTVQSFPYLMNYMSFTKVAYQKGNRNPVLEYKQFMDCYQDVLGDLIYPAFQRMTKVHHKT